MDQVQRSHVAVEAVMVVVVLMGSVAGSHDYEDALTKSILFFEGQRSGKLPSTQRMTWRKDSALHDGFEIGVDLVGGYYDAGDNVKFNFPMAFSTTMLAWSVLEYGNTMGPDLDHALEAIKWATDYFLKATSVPSFVFVQVGDPKADHNCWERPEDMDTPRTPYAVSRDFPGSEVSGEIAAALAASSLVFRSYNRTYSSKLLSRAKTVFQFADTYRGSYNDSLGPWVCPFYCDFNGYEDELVWAAAWLYKVAKLQYYWSYVTQNIYNLEKNGAVAEFGWDAKHAGINILSSKMALANSSNQDPFVPYADKFVCTILPESPTVSVSYSPGGLLFKPGNSNLQHTTALSFLLLTYARYLDKYKRKVQCGDVSATPVRLVQFAQGQLESYDWEALFVSYNNKIKLRQVDYILGSNPINMSYMVGYGEKFPERIHHRGSSLPSIGDHPSFIDCQAGSTYFGNSDPNPNLLIGAVVGGPDIRDDYNDSRADFVHTEPTTYINAPLVGLLAYFRSHVLTI